MKRAFNLYLSTAKLPPLTDCHAVHGGGFILEPVSIDKNYPTNIDLGIKSSFKIDLRFNQHPIVYAFHEAMDCIIKRLGSNTNPIELTVITGSDNNLAKVRENTTDVKLEQIKTLGIEIKRGKPETDLPKEMLAIFKETHALAAKGLVISHKSLDPILVDYEQPKVKKPKSETPSRLITGSQALLYTNSEEAVKKDKEEFGNKHVYYMASYEDDSKLDGKYFGKPSPLCRYTVSVIQEPFMAFEKLREFINESIDYDTAVRVFLNNGGLLAKNTLESIALNQFDYLFKYDANFILDGNTTLAKEVTIPYRTLMAGECLYELRNRLLAYTSDNLSNLIGDYTEIDITDRISLINDKNKRLFDDGCVTNSKYIILKEDKQRFKLCIGIDLPVLLDLKGIFRTYNEVKVKIITFDDDDFGVRHFQIIQADNDLSIMENPTISRRLKTK